MVAPRPVGVADPTGPVELRRGGATPGPHEDEPLNETSPISIGSSDAFAALTEPHRRELLVHCYRMLGSIDDAEDAVQDALVRAWRGRDTFTRAVSFRAWLYRIATNVCLDARGQRVRQGGVHGQIHEVGPFPDELLEPASPGPEARYDMHESISLAFLTVLQLLPPRQRAVLILRDVLNLRAAEVAALLEVTEPAVTSALHRARSTVSQSYERAGATGAAKRAVDPSRLRSLADRYVRFWESADIAGLVALLRDDAILSMPPDPSFVGAAQIGAFLAAAAFPDGQEVRLLPTRANGSLAFVGYQRMGPDGPFRAYVLIVLQEDLEATRIARLSAFFDERLVRWFGLPDAIAG